VACKLIVPSERGLKKTRKESDSLTSLRAIRTYTNKYEDLNWSDISNSDLLKSILIKSRTRPARTTFKWVKGHENNYSNIKADALANAGRENDAQMREDDVEWVNNHKALQDSARLQDLDASHTYKALLRWHTRKIQAIPHQITLDESKDRIEAETGL